MGTESPMAAGCAYSYDDNNTQTDISTHGDGGRSFCIELDPNSARTHYDAPASERNSARQRLAGLALPSSIDVFSLGVVTNKKWSNGRTLTVCFFGGSMALQQSVQNYASQWTQFANIKFHFVAGRNADIRIAFTGSEGRSDSYIGSQNSLVDALLPTMNLGLDDNSPPLTIQRTTLHEFGHALGCVHEHSQPNIDFDWDREAVIEDHRGIWSEKTVEHNIFKKYRPKEVRASAFDPYSIMLYPIPASWTYGKFSSRRNNTLSVNDQAFISAMYPFPSQPPPTQPASIKPTPIVVPPPMTMDYLLPHASSGDITAIKWSDSTSKPLSPLLLPPKSTTDIDEQIRIYYQRSDGYIYEGAWSGNKWNTESTKLVKAKSGTPITVVLTTSNPIDLRLYTLDDQNNIEEHCFMAGGWFKKGVLPSPSIATDTGLASYAWSDGSGAHINVYYQKSDAAFSTISYSVSSDWTVGAGLLLEGYKASSLSANQLGEDIHLYCQGSDSSLTMISSQPNRSSVRVDPMKSYQISELTGISAVSWSNNQRVYFVDHGSVYEMRNDGEGWIIPPCRPTNASTSPRTKLAAVVRSTDPVKISVYFLESGHKQLTEMAYDGNTWGLSKLPF